MKVGLTFINHLLALFFCFTCTTVIRAQHDPLAPTKPVSLEMIRECKIEFTTFDSEVVVVERKVANPLDKNSLANCFNGIQISIPEFKGIIEVSPEIRNVAVEWLQKVWKAHERVAYNLPLQPMVPFTTESEIEDIKQQIQTATPFWPSISVFPTIKFRVLLHAEKDTTSNKILVRRLILLPSPSSNTLKAMRQRFCLPAALIEESGIKAIEVFQLGVLGTKAFQEAFHQHNDEQKPLISDYRNVLTRGSDAEIQEMNIELLEKWQRFRSEHGKWPIVDAAFERSLSESKVPSDKEVTSPVFRDYVRDNGTKKEGASQTKSDSNRIIRQVERILFTTFYQSMSRFFSGSAKPAQELIEIQRGMRVLKEEFSHAQRENMESIFENRSILAFDSTGIYLIDGKTAIDLAFHQLQSVGLMNTDTNPVLNRDTGLDREEIERLDESIVRQAKEKKEFLTKSCIAYLTNFTFSFEKPDLPDPPLDPMTYRGPSTSPFDVAMEAIESSSADRITRERIKRVLITRRDGERVSKLDYPYLVIEAADDLLDAAKRSSRLREEAQQKSDWYRKVNSPTFNKESEYQGYLLARSNWDSECDRITTEWEANKVNAIAHWETKRGVLLAYVQSLERRNDKIEKTKIVESRIDPAQRIDLLIKANDVNGQSLICLIPSLAAIEKSIQRGRSNMGRFR